MNGRYAPGQTRLAAEPSGTSQTRLVGIVLVLARGIWLASFIAVLIILVVSIPAYITYLHTIRLGGVDIDSGQLTPAGLRSLHALGLSPDVYVAYLVSTKVLFISVWLAVGAILFWRKSDDRMALFTSFTLVIFSIGFGPWIAVAPPTWALLLRCVNFVGVSSIGIVLWIFPDGRFVPRWARWPIIVLNVVPEIYNSFLVIPLAAFPLFSALYNVNFVVGLISIVVVQVYRYWRVSTTIQRQQTKWAVFGIAVAMVGFVLVIAMNNLFPAADPPGTLLYLGLNMFLLLSLLCIPLSIGLAILRFHLWDIDILINRTLVYGALTVSIIGMYVFVVGYLGALLRTGNNVLISLIATGLVAVLFQPLRELLQRGVNRLFYGQRDDPYSVVSRLGQRLEVTLAPDAVLPTIVETVAQTLKLPYVAMTVQQNGTDVIAATFGSAKGELLHLPLHYQSEPIGELLLAPRVPGEAFTPADRALLSDLARQAGIATHAVQLTADLQRLTGELQQSRTQLITTREEERRRLRRDLHDGLGSALTSATFQLDAACNLLDHDPQAVRTLLVELKGQMQNSIADIRRLVYNLRPPILDEWGLVEALREQVAQYQLDQVQVTVDAPQALPVLPAAVEVAAYRIALEGLANAIRHAQASRCTIRLDMRDEVLNVEIQDDGAGLPPGYRAGVGISAMRERAAELGGSCVVENGPVVGTRVFARLPFMKE